MFSRFTSRRAYTQNANPTPHPKTWYAPNDFGLLDPSFDPAPNAHFQSRYSVPVGLDGAGNVCMLDIDKAPHILIAGTTGSGKSVCINAIICSLLLKNTPGSLNLAFIDPKRVDYIAYRDMPITKAYAVDLQSAVSTMETVHRIMMERYDRMQAAGVANFSQIKEHKILVIFDEFASLLGGSSKGKTKEQKNMENKLMFLVQDVARLGRASGIHMILASQYPTASVLDSQIKANCPTAICFRTLNGIQSRNVLDHQGAELLPGMGAGIIRYANGTERRFQGLMCSDWQRDWLVNFHTNQARTA